jgi:hypothetical protein
MIKVTQIKGVPYKFLGIWRIQVMVGDIEVEIPCHSQQEALSIGVGYEFDPTAKTRLGLD